MYPIHVYQITSLYLIKLAALKSLMKNLSVIKLWMKQTDFFFLVWVLWPFQEHFTYIKSIIHQRWAKTGEPGEKPPDHPEAELGFPTCDPSE